MSRLISAIRWPGSGTSTWMCRPLTMERRPTICSVSIILR